MLMNNQCTCQFKCIYTIRIISRFRAYQITNEICKNVSNNCKSRWFHGPGRDVIRMVGQRIRHGGPQRISIKKSIRSSTHTGRAQGQQQSNHRRDDISSRQSVGLIRGPSHLSKCKHMSFYAICLHATSALDSIATNNL